MHYFVCNHLFVTTIVINRSGWRLLKSFDLFSTNNTTSRCTATHLYGIISHRSHTNRAVTIISRACLTTTLAAIRVRFRHTTRQTRSFSIVLAAALDRNRSWTLENWLRRRLGNARTRAVHCCWACRPSSGSSMLASMEQQRWLFGANVREETSRYLNDLISDDPLPCLRLFRRPICHVFRVE